MKKEKEKVRCNNEIDFYNEVADDCILHMSDKDKEYLIENPRVIDYHFSYCMYIRNHYIHNRDFSEVSFFIEPDHMSSEIMQLIISKLLPEYSYSDMFMAHLYDHKGFIEIRKAYKRIYGYYPVDIVMDYARKIDLEPTHTRMEWYTNSEIDLDVELEILNRNHDKIFDATQRLVIKIAELVWQTERFKEIVAECGISYDEISEKVENIKKIFCEEDEYLPLEVCLLPYKKHIGQERYLAYRNALSKKLSDSPRLIEKIDSTYFYDRVLARRVLKHGWVLKYLPMYQDDDVMVRHSLVHDGKAIQYASKRFQKDREWVKLAIEHSKDGTIMFLDCMKPYCKDKELVYLACKVQRWNFVYVDKSFRDDFELAKLCMEQFNNPNSIFNYLSKRLKDNKELALLDLQQAFPHTEYYSARLRNDDEVAQKLYELHGTKSWAWYHMSKRLKKKYNIVDD